MDQTLNQAWYKSTTLTKCEMTQRSFNWTVLVYLHKEKFGDSLEEGEAPNDTIENDNKHKCSEIELELHTIFVQTIGHCQAVDH